MILAVPKSFQEVMFFFCSAYNHVMNNLVNSLFISDKEVLYVFFLKTVVTSFLKFERFFLFLLLDDYLQLKPR